MNAHLVVFVLSFFAMSGLSAPTVDEIPKPEANFSVIVVDKAMVSTQLEKASFEGEVVFMGYRGKGEVSISFNKVKHAAFVEADEPSYQLVRITLVDNQVVEIRMKNIITFYGMSELGPFRIKVKDISSLSFIGEKKEQPKSQGETH